MHLNSWLASNRKLTCSPEAVCWSGNALTCSRWRVCVPLKAQRSACNSPLITIILLPLSYASMLPRTFAGGNGNGGRIRREKKDGRKRRGDRFSEVISLISDLTGLLHHSSSLPHTHQPAENTHFSSFLSHWEPLYDFSTQRHTNTPTGSHTGAQSLETHMQSCTNPESTSFSILV